jgi:hypothetical protein
MVKMKQRWLSSIVGHRGWLRDSVMILMRLFRRSYPFSRLQPDLRFIRTLQSPYHVVMDEQTGRYRISSKAFSPSSVDGALSGDLEQVLDDDGLLPTAMYPAVGDAVGAHAARQSRWESVLPHPTLLPSAKLVASCKCSRRVRPRPVIYRMEVARVAGLRSVAIGCEAKQPGLALTVVTTERRRFRSCVLCSQTGRTPTRGLSPPAIP